MKKVLYISLLSVVVLACASCAKERASSGDTDGRRCEFIEFSPRMVNLQTKGAIVESLDSLQNDSRGLSLYGWYYLPGDNIPMFAMNNLPLKYAGSQWSYSPKHYWVNSAQGFGFAGIWPFYVSRNDGSITPDADRAKDKYHADDIVRNIIVHVESRTASLTEPLDDILMGYFGVEKENFGRTVNIPLEHTMCAFRIRVRNLSEGPIGICGWELQNLKCHADMIAGMIGRNEDGNVSQPMTFIDGTRFVDIQHAPVSERGTFDYIRVDGSGFIQCEDPNPGANNFKYIVISKRLPESSTDGSDIEAVKSSYSRYGNYAPHIYWGNTPGKGMNSNHYFIPLAYEKGASGPAAHGYASGSSFTGPAATSTMNGGIQLSVGESKEAILYSPYFFNDGSHATVDVDQCIAHYKAKDNVYTSCVTDDSALRKALDPDGFVLAYPQTIENLKFVISRGNLNAGASTYKDCSQKNINLADYTTYGIWNPGCKYDYLITITSTKILVTLDIEPWKDRQFELD